MVCPVMAWFMHGGMRVDVGALVRSAVAASGHSVDLSAWLTSHWKSMVTV
jgi:hypothetical protein